MNKKMKFGLTVLTVGTLALSSVTAFAGTAGVTNFVKGGHQGMVDLMLKDGVVTQAQIDKYEKQMHDERQATVKTNLQTLVTKGTLTQAKADAVFKSVEAQQAKMSALHDKLATMTQAEATTYMQQNPIERGNGMLTLVENGTLTAAEYDAVRAVIGMGGHGGMGGKGGHMGTGGHMGGRGMNQPATTTAK